MRRMLETVRPAALLLLVAGAATAAAAPPAKPDDEVISVAFSPDGREATSLGKDGTVRVWDALTGRERKKVSVPLEKDEVPKRVLYAPNGPVVLMSRCEGFRAGPGTATQGTISSRLWSTATGKRSPPVETGYGGVAVCPRGELLAYRDGLWEVGTGKKVRALDLPKGLVARIEFAPDGKSLAYWVCDGLAQDQSLILVLEVATGKKLLQVGEFDARLAGGFRSAPTFSGDGRAVLFTGPNFTEAHVSELGAGKADRTVRVGRGQALVGLTADGQALLTWERAAGRVRVWDLAAGKKLRSVEVGSSASSVALSPSGDALAITTGAAVEFRTLRE